MAVVTRNLYMCAFEYEFCTSVVIEQPQVPGDWVMTIATLFLKAVFVDIVFQVAIDTLIICANKHLAFMAGVALEVVVFTKQREFRNVVIEKWCFLPALFRVAIVTLIALLAAVRLVLQVAGGTECFR